LYSWRKIRQQNKRSIDGHMNVQQRHNKIKH
jgi:hypothetical protein